MSIRILWDKQEVALLIDTYEKIKSGDISKAEAIHNLSQKLRTRVMNAGVEIDEIFRNENGICMQMLKIEELFTDRQSGFGNASRLFVDMVNMYKNDRELFDEILMEAKTMSIQSENCEIDFLTWLIQKNLDAKTAKIKSALNWLSIFCLKNKFVEKPILQIRNVDIISSLLDNIKTNRVRVVQSKKQLHNFLNALSIYEKYLNELKYGAQKGSNMNENDNSVKTVNIEKDSMEIISQNGDTNDEIVLKTEKEKFENWMMNEDCLSLRSAQSYSSAVNVAGVYITEHGYDELTLFEMKNSNRILECINRLLIDDEFIKINAIQHNRYIGALNKYRNYCIFKGTDTNICLKNESVLHKNDEVSAEKKEQYTTILIERFSNGFRPNNAIDIARLKKYYERLFCAKCSDSDEDIVGFVSAVGIQREERFFATTDDDERELLNEIRQIVVDTLATKASCVYSEPLFERYHQKLVNDLWIFTAEALIEALMLIADGAFTYRYSYLMESNKEVDCINDVREYLKEEASPKSYNELVEDLWVIPLSKVKNILTTTPDIVRTAEGVYMYAPSLPVTENELVQITDLIHQELVIKSYLLDSNLRELVHKKIPSVAINTESYSILGWRNALSYLLRDSFSFQGRIISSLGNQISMAQVYCGFAEVRNSFSLQDLQDFSTEIGTGIYYESLYEVAVRISNNEFVNRMQVQFPLDEIDALLDTFVQGDYISIQDIDMFLHFPGAGYRWNCYLLESFVYGFSKKFRLIHQNFNAQDCCGAIVKKNSAIQDYPSLILDVLINSNCWKSKDSVLQMLVDEGYQSRRTFSGIENIMQEAKLLREKIEK